jgi:hypothetical protein
VPAAVANIKNAPAIAANDEFIFERSREKAISSTP